MIIAIIPSHNQAQHIEKIIRSYEKQTLRPDFLLFVLDRCTDNSEDVLKSIVSDLEVAHIVKTEGDNFSAGMTRDFGIDRAEEYCKYNNRTYEMILFTDGDCYPNETVVEDHYKNCIIRETPIVSCGRRIMQSETGKDDEDERLSEWANGFSFVPRDGRVILSTRTALESIFTYSCNLAFNKSAIALCKKVNLILSGEPRVFNPEFDGSWGGEDNFISDCLFRTGNFITLSHIRSFVYHPWHKTRTVETDRRAIWKSMSSKLFSEIYRKTIDGPITLVERNRFIVEPLKLSGVLNNIYSVMSNTTPFTDNRDIYFFSRNFFAIRCREDRPKNGQYTEEQLMMDYDKSAFRKFYLTRDGIIEDTDYSTYNFKRNITSCQYCSLNN